MVKTMGPNGTVDHANLEALAELTVEARRSEIGWTKAKEKLTQAKQKMDEAKEAVLLQIEEINKGSGLFDGIGKLGQEQGAESETE
jgi:uncharacterized protein YpuA (DUF1002 family)